MLNFYNIKDLNNISFNYLGKTIISPKIKKKVNAYWEKINKNNLYSNDKIINIINIDPFKIQYKSIEYKYFHYFCSKLNKNNFPDINIMAVTGVIKSKNGFIMGLRNNLVNQDKNKIEFLPSGSVSFANPLKIKHIKGQIINEINEELGISKNYLSNIILKGFFYDKRKNITDFIFFLNTRLYKDDVLKKFSKIHNKEHTKIYFLKNKENFNRKNLNLISKKIIKDLFN